MMENICEWEADTILFFVCMMLVPGSVQSDIGWWRQQDKKKNDQIFGSLILLR